MPQSDQPARRRRILRVVISIVATAAVCIGYIAADVFDLVPGVLTERPVRIPRYGRPPTALGPGMVIGDVVRHKAIDAKSAGAFVDEFSRAQGLGSDFSVAIADDQGGLIAGRDQDTPREPASTMKTLTALATASTMDMGSTLTTSVYLDQTSVDRTLTLTGTGDMLLGSGQSDPDHINGRAGLATLADATVQALRQRGIGSVRLVYDDSLFGATRAPDHIAQNNQGNRFFTPLSSMAIDGGRQWGGAGPSDPDVFESYPELSTHTAVDTAQRFAALLKISGIGIAGPVGAGRTPSGISPLASVHSATLGEIMAFMLRHSDNMLAEEFGRLLAIHTGTGNSPSAAVEAVRRTLKSMGIDISGLTMADCAGLSPGSRVTVKTLAQVQARNLQPGAGSAAAEGLSIPGALGTAVDRLDDQRAAGLLRVKTGSLDTVTSMTGNVSRLKGGTLAFAVIVNNPRDIVAARQAIDGFIARLVEL